VRIDDLARSMIRLMGAEVRDRDHPDGDVAIEYIGLRPGEKLVEELLIGSNTSKTEHPRILKCSEPHLAAGELTAVLDALRAAMARKDGAAIHAVLTRSVGGYRAEDGGSPPRASRAHAGTDRVLTEPPALAARRAPVPPARAG